MDTTSDGLETKAGAQSDIAALFAEFSSAFEEFKATNDQRLGALEKRGSADGLLEGKLDRLNAVLDSNKAAMDRALIDRARPQLDGKAIHQLPTREVATRLGVLPQTPVAPDGITVADLVGRGRYPHQGWFRHWSAADDAIVTDALTATGALAFADRPVDELSGGQRQRVWIAMALAQQTELLLLDEPTTFLDINHQVEVLDLVTDLVTEKGRTVVAVLHDLNLACRYADHIVAMCGGRIVDAGAPSDVVTPELVFEVFGVRAQVIADPVSQSPMVVPIGRHHQRLAAE